MAMSAVNEGTFGSVLVGYVPSGIGALGSEMSKALSPVERSATKRVLPMASAPRERGSWVSKGSWAIHCGRSGSVVSMRFTE